MKRKIILAGFCALLVFAALLMFSTSGGKKRGSAPVASQVITQEGKLVPVPQGNRAKMSVLWQLPKPSTNNAPAAK